MTVVLDFLITNKTYVVCFLAGMLATYLVTPLVSMLAWRAGAVDKPNHRKIHARETPLMGGLAIYLGMWLPLLALAFWDNAVTERVADQWWQFFVVAMSGAAVMLSGILDDIRGLNVTKKLLVQVPLALLFTIFIGHFDHITLPVLGPVKLGIWGFPLTILWIIGITNALNLIDGIDGLATGVAFFVALTTAIFAIMGGKDFLVLVMLAMSGACLGFLRYNFAPAKIFLGDTGSLFLGMTLATASVLANSKGHVAASLLVAIIAFGYPVMDTLLAMGRRGLHGKPMFVADRGHIHHRLLDKGLGHRRSAMIIYAFCAALSMLALAIVAENNLASMISLLLVAAMMALGLNSLGIWRLLLPSGIKETRARLLAAHHLSEMLIAKISVAESMKDIYELFEQACAEFDMLSLQIEVAPERMPREEPERHVWVNEDRKHEKVALENLARVKEDVLYSSDGDIEVRVLYSSDRERDMSNDYVFQISRLLDAAEFRIKDLWPASKQAAEPETGKQIAGLGEGMKSGVERIG